MTNLLLPLIVVASVALVMVGLVRLAARMRRDGRSGSAIGAAMAAYDEAMHSTAQESFAEVQADADRSRPPSTPDGGDFASRRGGGRR